MRSEIPLHIISSLRALLRSPYPRNPAWVWRRTDCRSHCPEAVISHWAEISLLWLMALPNVKNPSNLLVYNLSQGFLNFIHPHYQHGGIEFCPSLWLNHDYPLISYFKHLEIPNPTTRISYDLVASRGKMRVKCPRRIFSSWVSMINRHSAWNETAVVWQLPWCRCCLPIQCIFWSSKSMDKWTTRPHFAFTSWSAKTGCWKSGWHSKIKCICRYLQHSKHWKLPLRNCLKKLIWCLRPHGGLEKCQKERVRV